jgi:hypothetical protein
MYIVYSINFGWKVPAAEELMIFNYVSAAKPFDLVQDRFRRIAYQYFGIVWGVRLFHIAL